MPIKTTTNTGIFMTIKINLIQAKPHKTCYGPWRVEYQRADGVAGQALFDTSREAGRFIAAHARNGARKIKYS